MRWFRGRRRSEPVFAVDRWHVLDAVRRDTRARSLTLLTTPSTSAEVLGLPDLDAPDLSGFERVERWLYAAPEQRAKWALAEGVPSLDQVAEGIRAAPTPTDVVYVDPWHTYEASLRSFELALPLVTAGGWMVVHDCLPRDVATVDGTTEECWDHPWCGETWRAFIDIVRRLPAGSDAFLVDSDHGIGLVRPAGLRPLVLGPRCPTVVADPDPVRAWRWYLDHVGDLIEVVSAREWSTGSPLRRR